MTWTYSAEALTTDLAKTRLLIGDTVPSDPQFQDEEISLALADRGNVYGAAAFLCRALAARLSREVDTVDRDLRTTYSARSRAYRSMANDYEMRAKVRSGATPYAGGLSVADKVRNELDPDRVQPQFKQGADTNYYPVPPIGNEGTPDDEGAMSGGPGG